MADKIDVVFAYLLAFITAVALNVVPDMTYKIAFVVFSFICVLIASVARAWAEKVEVE